MSKKNMTTTTASLTQPIKLSRAVRDLHLETSRKTEPFRVRHLRGERFSPAWHASRENRNVNKQLPGPVPRGESRSPALPGAARRPEPCDRDKAGRRVRHPRQRRGTPWPEPAGPQSHPLPPTPTHTPLLAHFVSLF